MKRDRPERVFAGGIATETNLFVSLPTGIDDFALVPPSASQAERSGVLFGSTFAVYQERAAAHGVELVLGSYAFAQPGGLTSQATYELLRDGLLSELGDALPVSGVLLTLHGAMAAGGYLDCETDLATRVRALAPEARIALLLDPHCDLPDDLIEAVDLIVCYKEYPHTDIHDCAEDLFELLIRAVRGDTQPTMATFDCRMIGTYPTTVEPMRTFVRKLEECERRSDVLSVSLSHSYPYGDAPSVGARMLVSTDANKASAAALAECLGREFFDLRHEVTMRPFPMDVVLDLISAAEPADGPIVVADVADNPGAGAPGDATFVLSELLRQGVRDVAIAIVWDPIAAHVALAAGIGAELDLRIGAKMGRTSGLPVDAVVTVRGVVPELVQRWPQSTGHVDVASGSAVWLETNGIDIIVGTVRTQVLGVEVFTAVGIDPRGRRALIVKSRNHFRAAFEGLASQIVYMEAPGPLPEDPRKIPYRRVDRLKFPWVEDPWA